MKTLEYKDGCLYLLDQTALPSETRIIPCRTYQETARAIRKMIVRGAPAIGVAAAYGLALAARSAGNDGCRLIALLCQAKEELARTRPTAVNLFWALERMSRLWAAHPLPACELAALLEEEAHRIAAEDLACNKELGSLGCELIPDGANILTHCNAGALATSGYGTALGVIRAAHEGGKSIQVFADETRPLLQGARLTAWELLQDNIPVTLITDSMAGYLMQQGRIDLVIVGADRIAANGDTANKIGTYSLAVLAQYHHIPFYVAAPSSTVDLTVPSGGGIPIEERDPDEIRRLGGVQLAPETVRVYNPAFDITPHELITAIITERAIVYPSYQDNLPALF
ncbi:MAG: S-methyl-5-thioribose-1-phosphate isomerase [Clostridia bacterium]|jgi:methylthioribose-1-phosphate isomerase|nr:S-methyl-5-thioribose-1-phosphate isomerase [Clostridia bacterium]